MPSLITGQNDLVTWCKLNHREDVLASYDYNANPDPSMVAKGSHKKYYWRCERCGKQYLRIPHNIRLNSSNLCEGCIHKNAVDAIKTKAITSNNLESLHPELVEEWDFEMNEPLLPSQVSAGAHEKVWWKGKCGHKWDAVISGRVRGDGCPYCSNHRLLPGFNDLKTKNPTLAAEWHPTKNGELTPDEFMSTSHKKVWWLGPCGHEWKASISGRTSGDKCPICNNERKTSFPEQALFYYISRYFDDAINSDTDTIGMELDIYIPSLKTAIEYDGVAWHGDNRREIVKNEKCKQHRIKLIRVRETGLSSYDECICVFRKDNKGSKDLDRCISEVLYLLGIESALNIDTDRDANDIYSLYIVKTKENSLATVYPDLAKEWHPTKNGVLTPEMISKSSGKKIWWLKSCGHEWYGPVSYRIKNPGCPYCTGKKVLTGFNDLAAKRPDVASEWNYEKNNGLLPSEVSYSSNKIVWWKCSKGHEWRTSINNRTSKNSKCSICTKCRRIMCCETGKIFESITEAATVSGLTIDAIQHCCKGKSKTSGGYHWKYVDE